MFGKENEQYYPDPYSMPPTHQRITQSSESDMEYAEQIRNEKIANVISQINPETLLDEIEHRIKGERKKDGSWVRIATVEVNPVFVKNTISYLSAILDQNTTLSNLNSMQINKIMNLVIEAVLDDIDTHADEYGLGDNYTERTRIAHMVISPVFFVLCRAESGLEARRIFSALRVNENLNQSPQQKKGLFSSLKFWS